MSVGEKLPWLWNKNKKKTLPISKEDHPFGVLQRQVNGIFEDFFSAFDDTPFAGWSQKFAGFTPKVDVTEDDSKIEVHAELPGLDEKNIELSLTSDALTIRGEKTEERRDESEKGRRYVERSFGSFERVIPLNVEVEQDKVDASFKNGVLTIQLPKSQKAQDRSKKISIRS